jgi:hypothetical protein
VPFFPQRHVDVRHVVPRGIVMIVREQAGLDDLGPRIPSGRKGADEVMRIVA